MITKEKTKAELRREVKRAIDRLSDERLRAAAEFLAYLQYMESEEATQEILRIPGAIEQIEQGIKDIAEGKMINWREVRRDV
jgi:hypothetical protein